MTKYDLLPEFKRELQHNVFEELNKLEISPKDANQIIQTLGYTFDNSEWKHYIEREIYKQN